MKRSDEHARTHRATAGLHSTGKTHTVVGQVDSSQHAGLIPRILHAVFARLPELERGPSPPAAVHVRVSCVEIYNEQVRDLLNSGAALRIRESSLRGVWVDGAVIKPVATAEAALEVAMAGLAGRTTAATAMNDASSRSHAVFRLLVQQEFPDGSRTSAQLDIVDLAGSERVARSGVSGLGLQEAKTINASLSTLGLCLGALTQARRSHVPYRDSKLTHMLKESLGGNAKISVIVCCSPADVDTDETLSSLRFARTASSLHNAVHVNREVPPAELAAQVESLLKFSARLESDNVRLRAALQKAGIAAPVSPAGSAASGPSARDGTTAAAASPSSSGMSAQAYAELEVQLREAQHEAGQHRAAAQSALASTADMQAELSELADKAQAREAWHQAQRAKFQQAADTRAAALRQGMALIDKVAGVVRAKHSALQQAQMRIAELSATVKEREAALDELQEALRTSKQRAVAAQAQQQSAFATLSRVSRYRSSGPGDSAPSKRDMQSPDEEQVTAPSPCASPIASPSDVNRPRRRRTRRPSTADSSQEGKQQSASDRADVTTDGLRSITAALRNRAALIQTQSLPASQLKSRAPLADTAAMVPTAWQDNEELAKKKAERRAQVRAELAARRAKRAAELGLQDVPLTAQLGPLPGDRAATVATSMIPEFAAAAAALTSPVSAAATSVSAGATTTSPGAANAAFQRLQAEITSTEADIRAIEQWKLACAGLVSTTSQALPASPNLMRSPGNGCLQRTQEGSPSSNFLQRTEQRAMGSATSAPGSPEGKCQDDSPQPSPTRPKPHSRAGSRAAARLLRGHESSARHHSTTDDDDHNLVLGMRSRANSSSAEGTPRGSAKRSSSDQPSRPTTLLRSSHRTAALYSAPVAPKRRLAAP